MTPPFFFQIFGMREDPHHPRCIDSYGRWSPPKRHGANITCLEQNSSMLYCDGISIRRSVLPGRPRHFKTFSIYFSNNYFWIVNYDATDGQVGDGVEISSDGTTSAPGLLPAQIGRTTNWQCMTFDYNTPCDYASTATYGGEHLTLQMSRTDQRWVHRLLPSGHRPEGPSISPDYSYGGMSGELPLILGLLAFSVAPYQLDWFFENHFIEGSFRTTSQVPHGRSEGRGMVVMVWAHPDRDPTDLVQYGDGEYGNIFL